ncbi:MAG TPA: oligoendopeptidase F [Thermomicrobiales bacterium]|nr:oligoendopeptidase F [Thermomicrobiales bacterium]
MSVESAPTTLPRDQVPVEERWDIESVFPTIEAWDAEFERLEALLPEIESARGTLNASGDALLAALQRRDDILRDVDKLATYAFLRQSEDSTNQAFGELADRAASIWARAQAAAAYVEPEILAIPKETIDRFVADVEGLEAYRHYFDVINLRREHTRSAEVEELLARTTELTRGFASIHNALENADLDLGTITDEHGVERQLSHGNLQVYLSSQDRRVREEAWKTAADAYLSVRNSMAQSLAGSFKSDVFYARARRYDTALQAALAPVNVPEEVFFNLLDTVKRNLPTWHRYFRIRRRILGVDQLHEWDITAPLVKETTTIPWERGIQMILDSLEPLGEEYVSILREGAEQRWVDRCANIGKHGGAFSGGAPGTPPFISMTYSDDFQSVSTLTHEFGHSMHSYYTWETQPYVYTDYGMMVAETASNMHQALLGKKLLNEVDDPNFLIEIIEERMANHMRYFFTMPILARFELECHTHIERGGALSAASMSELLADIYEESYGGAVVVDRERMGITWARFPHLFAAYYVFNYAIGIAAAAELSNQVLAEGEPAAERYLDFLRAGDSKYQIDALRDAGVDMTDPAPVQAAFDLLASYVDRLDELTQ